MTTQHTLTDAELVAAIRSRADVNRALLYLYKRYYHLLERYVLNNKGSETEAEDLVQEVMVSLVDLVQRGTYRGEASLKSLLFTLARNHWVTMLRKRDSDGKRNETFETERDLIVNDVSEYVLDEEAQRTLSALFDRLGEGCRTILQLFYYQNLSMKEILERTSYGSEPVLRNKKHKCLKDLTEYVHSSPGLFETVRDALRRTR